MVGGNNTLVANFPKGYKEASHPVKLLLDRLSITLMCQNARAVLARSTSCKVDICLV